MQNPELVPEGPQDPLPRLEGTSAIQGEAQAKLDTALRFGNIEDPTDRELSIAAARFVESPTNNLPEIDSHLKNIGDVLATFMMTGADAPPEVDSLHADLLQLFCQHHIDNARRELASEAPDNAALDLAIRMALDSAKNLKAYDRPSYLEEVRALETQVAELRGS